MADFLIAPAAGLTRFVGKVPQRWIGPAPANDECAGAIALSGVLPLHLHGTNYHATWTDDDWYWNSVWYTWTAPSSDAVVVEVDSALDLYLTVYSGACGALTLIDYDTLSVPFTATSGTTYYFKVETYDDIDGGDFAIWLRSPVVVDAPVLSMDPPAYSRNLLVSWTEPVGATYFYLERALGAGSFIQILATALAAYTDRALTEATTYRYRVRASNGEAFSDYSNIVTGATLAGEVGVERFAGAAGLVSDLGRCSANNHPALLGFGSDLASSYYAPVGLTQGFGDGDVEPPYTYRLQLTYYATSDYASTALTDRIVVTTGGYGAGAPGDPHTVEMRFVTGSRDVLTRTARADGWIEARLDGTVILRVDDIKVFPSTEVVPWDSVVVCGAGSFTSWFHVVVRAAGCGVCRRFRLADVGAGADHGRQHPLDRPGARHDACSTLR
jgi:hypothetical protein